MPLIKKNDSKTPLRFRQIGELTMVPFYLAGGPLVGWWIGGWTDQKFGTGPYLRAGLMVLGLLAGARETWRIVRQVSENE